MSLGYLTSLQFALVNARNIDNPKQSQRMRPAETTIFVEETSSQVNYLSTAEMCMSAYTGTYIRLKTYFSRHP